MRKGPSPEGCREFLLFVSRRQTRVDELSSPGLLSTGLWPRAGCGVAGSRGRLLPWAVWVFWFATGVIVFPLKRYHRLSGRVLPPLCGEGLEPRLRFPLRRSCWTDGMISSAQP